MAPGELRVEVAYSAAPRQVDRVQVTLSAGATILHALRASGMLDLLGLAKKADLRPSQMSGGEKQRVAIGRALIKEPAFCFADEPTAALDWKHGEQVIELLRMAAHDEGATILVVAHDSRIIPFGRTRPRRRATRSA